mgnify:CR=1 FL=1
MGEFNTRSMGEKPKAQNGDLAYILNQMKNKHLSWSLWNYDTQLDNDHPNKDWSPIHYKGLNVDEKSDKFGEKENTKNNDIVFNALKAASK